MVSRVVGNAGSPPNEHCACGAVHRVPTDVVVIDEHAVEQLVAYVKERGWSRPFVVMDANTEEAAGSHVSGELSGAKMRVTTFCFSERSGLLANETSVSRLHEALKVSGTDSIVAVGSGVITDTTRYVASLMGREFVSVPTAASMDGYASNLAVMEFGGMKTSFPVAPPVAIFADPRTIAASVTCLGKHLHTSIGWRLTSCTASSSAQRSSDE
jgi:glycerol-1-phosphate dehydrogenase [NAD(P)+]